MADLDVRSTDLPPRRRGRKPKAEQDAYEREVAEAYRYYVQGHSLGEVAEKFGWGHTDSVANAFDLRGWPRRDQETSVRMALGKWSPEREKLLRKLFDEGRTIKFVAEVLELSRVTVSRKASELGIRPSPKPITHGRSGYVRGCRCDTCRAANAEQMRNQIRKNRRERREPPQHGTHQSYGYYGCRCDECRQAHTDYYREYQRTYSQTVRKAKKESQSA